MRYSFDFNNNLIYNVGKLNLKLNSGGAIMKKIIFLFLLGMFVLGSLGFGVKGTSYKDMANLMIKVGNITEPAHQEFVKQAFKREGIDRSVAVTMEPDEVINNILKSEEETIPKVDHRRIANAFVKTLKPLGVAPYQPNREELESYKQRKREYELGAAAGAARQEDPEEEKDYAEARETLVPSGNQRGGAFESRAPSNPDEIEMAPKSAAPKSAASKSAAPKSEAEKKTILQRLKGYFR